MPGLLGKKIGMTSVFSAEGKNVPCTVIEAGPCVVTQVKTVEKDGYAAVQLGFQDKKEKHTTKPLMGHFKRAGVTPKRHLAEFKEFEGWTNKFIFPPYEFTVANSMISNFHMPLSTLLMIVAAFGGYEQVMDAYHVALKEGYRFGTYGDAMLILDK